MADFQFPPLNNSKQFEGLACDLFNELFKTVTFKCFGKNGHKQKGIDVFSAAKQIVVQCKLKDLTRNPVVIKKELFSAIDETIEQLLIKPSVLPINELFILTTASDHPDFDEYCQAIKSGKNCPFNISFWGWETIQRKLGLCTETVKIHYPNNIASQITNADIVKSRLSMKKRIEQDFGDWLNYSVENRKRRSRMIIHSIDDKDYPNHVKNEHDEYQWFGAEINRLSKNGLGFFRELKDIYVTDGGWWTEKQPDDLTNFKLTRVSLIGVVAFEDIVDYDLRGDEHYPCPHFYLRFIHGGQPFSESYYQNMETDKRGVLFFDDSTRIDLLNA